MGYPCATYLRIVINVVALGCVLPAHAALVDVQTRPLSGNLLVQTQFDTFARDGYVLDSVGFSITGVMTLNFAGPALLFPPPPGLSVVSHDFSGAVDSRPNPSFLVRVTPLPGVSVMPPVVVPFEYDFTLTDDSDLEGFVETLPVSTSSTTRGSIRGSRATFIAPPAQRALRIATRLTVPSDPQQSLIGAQMSGVLQISYAYSPLAEESPTSPPAPVPLPAALPLSGAAIMMLGLMRGRRIRRRCAGGAVETVDISSVNDAPGHPPIARYKAVGQAAAFAASST